MAMSIIILAKTMTDRYWILDLQAIQVRMRLRRACHSLYLHCESLPLQVCTHCHGYEVNLISHSRCLLLKSCTCCNPKEWICFLLYSICDMTSLSTLVSTITNTACCKWAGSLWHDILSRTAMSKGFRGLYDDRSKHARAHAFCFLERCVGMITLYSFCIEHSRWYGLFRKRSM